MRLVLLLALLLALPARAEILCETCDAPGGSYALAVPAGEGPFPVLMHLHGMGGTGPGTIRGGTASRAVERGYAVIAPTGFQPGRRYPKNWAVFDRQTPARDDIAFLKGVMAAASARAPLDLDRVLLAGFSRGGSMVWDIACRAPEMARAFAPVAGAFWDDLPESCARPVDLFHTPGWMDRTVPLEGRSFREGAIVQGDVWASLFILRETNGCVNRQPETGSAEGARWWRHWSDCQAGRIDLMLHPGGHGVPKGWADEILDWFEARLAEGDPS
ncbi:MAG: polyhydroxybutyrate depolymerase [Pseudomonadota bacterium]